MSALESADHTADHTLRLFVIWKPGLCVWCGGKVGALRSQDGRRVRRGLTLAYQDPNGLFCRQVCASAYGVDVARQRIGEKNLELAAAVAAEQQKPAKERRPC